MSATVLDVAEDVPPSLTQRIREAILTGEFAASQRLVEADLTEQFGASRAAVRLALVDLSHEGLVERLPNRGARVRSISREEAIEIVEARMGLEALCARKAAEQLGEDDAVELRALRADLVAAVDAGDLVAYSRLLQDLDRRIRELSGHLVADALLERLHAQSARHQFRIAFTPGRARSSLTQHLAIIDAVLAHDPVAAREATRVHLLDVIAILAKSD